MILTSAGMLALNQARDLIISQVNHHNEDLSELLRACQSMQQTRLSDLSNSLTDVIRIQDLYHTELREDANALLHIASNILQDLDSNHTAIQRLFDQVQFTLTPQRHKQQTVALILKDISRDVKYILISFLHAVESSIKYSLRLVVII